jgi:hypothetical protein
MMAIGFTRGFQHEDWVDNVDRVQAAGDNGFNTRFHEIEADFDEVGAVVDLISRALDALSATPPAVELRQSVTPAFVATAATGWSHRTGFAEKVAGQTTGAGMVGLTLPHGSRVLRLRAIGRNAGVGNLRIMLQRQAIADPGAAAEQLARVDGATDPFDVTALVDPNLTLVESDRFKYFITAQLNNAGAGDAVQITGLQVVYSTN